MWGMFSHASGISIMTPCVRARPDTLRTSSALSRLSESLPTRLTSGRISSTVSRHTGDRSSGSRELIQFRFPWIVLISPL